MCANLKAVGVAHQDKPAAVRHLRFALQHVTSWDAMTISYASMCIVYVYLPAYIEETMTLILHVRFDSVQKPTSSWVSYHEHALFSTRSLQTGGYDTMILLLELTTILSLITANWLCPSDSPEQCEQNSCLTERREHSGSAESKLRRIHFSNHAIQHQVRLPPADMH